MHTAGASTEPWAVDRLRCADLRQHRLEKPGWRLDVSSVIVKKALGDGTARGAAGEVSANEDGGRSVRTVEEELHDKTG